MRWGKGSEGEGPSLGPGTLHFPQTHLGKPGETQAYEA